MLTNTQIIRRVVGAILAPDLSPAESGAPGGGPGPNLIRIKYEDARKVGA